MDATNKGRDQAHQRYFEFLTADFDNEQRITTRSPETGRMRLFKGNIIDVCCIKDIPMVKLVSTKINVRSHNRHVHDAPGRSVVIIPIHLIENIYSVKRSETAEAQTDGEMDAGEDVDEGRRDPRRSQS